MRLLAAISHHGLGHLAQAGPVLSALKTLEPGLELTVWSGLAPAALAARLPFPFRHRQEAADVGLAMHDALGVDLATSHRAYLDFHRDWPARLAREARWLAEEGFDGVFSDVAYLPLAAARNAGIPAVALCSLNWRDIAAAYLAQAPGMAPILEDMARAYAGARAFLRPEPSMPMDWLANGEAVPPIASLGRSRRAELDGRLGRRAGTRRVLAGFGGIPFQGSLARLPGVTWLAPDGWGTGRDDVVPFPALDMPFLDLVASCDVLLTKVGYGGFAEAAANGVPALYVDRPDWPETPWLAAWLEEHNRARAIRVEDLGSPRLGEMIDALLARPAPPPPVAEGALAAARRLLTLLA
ncbi:MAG: hypothetical protein AB1899_00935 [Pseudomonadota bacterium]